jgi:uncharacterized protein YaiI (UPF0178 family)
MILYIDGDAFPNALKDILLRSIIRKSLKTIAISNKEIYLGESALITYKVVKAGPDEADHLIAELASEGDLVITADIPLADRVIEKKAFALNHRGELFTKDTIKQHLAVRNFMTEMREGGVLTKGPAPFGKKDASLFAAKLNAFLDKNLK